MMKIQEEGRQERWMEATSDGCMRPSAKRMLYLTPSLVHGCQQMTCSNAPDFTRIRTSMLLPSGVRKSQSGKLSEIQANLLSAAIELATGGTAQPHVGTGGRGSTSELPRNDKDKNLKKRTSIERY